jgi:hypothetical protein
VRYLGCKQKLPCVVNDRLGIKNRMPRCDRYDEGGRAARRPWQLILMPLALYPSAQAVRNKGIRVVLFRRY